uniref:Uncharacterized protein n=1 Tax=Rhizophora mucronata TaxID=61149 RepID=A0A2P2Q7E8_RHIMU
MMIFLLFIIHFKWVQILFQMINL